MAAVIFRRKERQDLLKIIMEALINFTKKIPRLSENNSESLHTFEKFKQQVCQYLAIITAPDVREAVAREIQGGIDSNAGPQIDEKIAGVQRQLQQVVELARSAELPDYCALFESLQRHCQFWFEVKKQDSHRIRRSDVTISKTIDRLMAKYRDPTDLN